MRGIKENSMVEKKAENTVKTERQRQKRRPFGVPVSKLSVNGLIEGYHLRWINDEPGRISNAQDSGYSFVEPSEVGRESREDNKVKELVGVQRDEKTPMFAYLMKIPMEFYLEDRALMNEQLDEIDNAIRGGKIDRQVGDGRYVPEGGISYKTK
jgi:hypothetical protein